MPNLVLIRGLPGSGKSTLAKEKFSNYLHFEADMFFIQNGKYIFEREKLSIAHDWCYHSTRIALQHNNSVVVSNTFSKRWEIQRYLDLHSSPQIITCTGEYKSIHGVPQEIISAMRARWEDLV